MLFGAVKGILVVVMIYIALNAMAKRSGTHVGDAVRNAMGKSGKMDKAAEAGRDEGALDQREIQKERSIIEILDDIRKRLDELTKGKRTTEALNEMKDDLAKLSTELKGLSDLEVMEKGKEDIRRGLGVRTGKVYELLAGEQNYVRGFEKLINQGIKSMDNPRLAKDHFDKARAVMQQLIRINRKQVRSLK